MKKITQTASRASLDGLAPDFARFNDEVLLGKDRNIADLDHKTRCIITIIALASSGI